MSEPLISRPSTERPPLAGVSRDAVAAAVIAVAPDLLSVRVRAITDAVMAEVAPVQAELSWRAHHDPLTGLANRALFHDHLVAAQRRHGEVGQSFALLVLDLDGFKAVNDTFGHAVGDELLRLVAGRLRGCVRGGDLVARLGGDEFGVLLQGSAAAGTVADHVVATLDHPFHVAGHTVTVGASVGVAVPASQDAGLAPEVLLGRADGAMYVGKQRGNGQAVHYRPGLLGDLATEVA